MCICVCVLLVLYIVKEEVEAIKDTLAMMNIRIFKKIEKDEVRIIVTAKARTEEKFELIVKHNDIGNLACLIRVSMMNCCPFWWFSVIYWGGKYLDEMTEGDLKETFVPGKAYSVSMSLIDYFATNWGEVSSTAPSLESGNDSEANCELKLNDSSNNNYMILGKVNLSIVLNGGYDNVYGKSNTDKQIQARVEEMIANNNKLNVLQLNEQRNNCFANGKNFRKRFEKVFKMKLCSQSMFCILTSKEHTKDYEVRVGHIVKQKPSSQAAILWLLNDMIWQKVCGNYMFVSVHDFRNVIPLSAPLEKEFDALYWSFFPQLLFETDENGNDIFEWNIIVFSNFPNLAINEFLDEHGEEGTWRTRLDRYFKIFHTFRRGLALHCFAALAYFGYDSMIHDCAINWMDYLSRIHRIDSNNNKARLTVCDSFAMADIG